MASQERDGVSVWRIEGEQHIRYTNVTTPSISPYEKMVSPERDKPRSLQMMASQERDGVSVWRIEGEQHIRYTNVTTPSISPYEKMASPERDKPRSIRMMASPERDKPRSLRKDGFAGTGRAAFPTKRWLRRNAGYTFIRFRFHNQPIY